VDPVPDPLLLFLVVPAIEPGSKLHFEANRKISELSNLKIKAEVYAIILS
jgi:hypothetical protein